MMRERDAAIVSVSERNLPFILHLCCSVCSKILIYNLLMF